MENIKFPTFRYLLSAHVLHLTSPSLVISRRPGCKSKKLSFSNFIIPFFIEASFEAIYVR